MKIMKLKDIYRIVALSFICISAFSQSYVYNGNIVGISGSHLVNKLSTSYDSKTISGEYLTILGKGNTSIKKPFIIIEGIDFLNNQDFDTHLSLYNDGNGPLTNLNNSLIYSLYNNGYDVIILDFDNATDYIQNNAMLLVSLINNLSITDDNLVVMGFSMGGLVARYALTWMESNGQNHHTRLYISHDSPHKGANFPIGLQELIEDVRNNTAIAWIAVDIIIKTFEYNMPAARQMLVYHYLNSKDGIAKPSDDKLNLFTEMYNLNPQGNGYPSKPVKIAISNGNYSGKPQSGFSDGDNLLYFDYWKKNEPTHLGWPLCGLFDFNGCDLNWASDHLTATVRVGFDESTPLEEFSFYSLGKHSIGNTGVKFPLGGSGTQTYNSSNYSYDIASGSNSPNFMNLLEDAISANLTSSVQVISNTCFIPTISALDLNVGLSESFGLNNSQCNTNFDYIHANLNANNDHFSLTVDAKNFIINHLLANEKPIKRVVYDGVSIEIANKTVNSGEQYNKTVSNSISNTGSFVIKSNGSSNLTAGNSIILNPGFSVESGGTFNASIISGQMCPNPIGFNPHYLAPQLKSGTTSVNEVINYDCSNYVNLPSYSSDSLYFDCFQTEVPTSEQLDSLLNKNITIYPNPTTGIITIEFSSEIVLSYLKIKVYDYMGNNIYSLNNVTTNTLTINLSNAMTGLLAIEFNLNNGNYIYTRKMLKQ